MKELTHAIVWGALVMMAPHAAQGVPNNFSLDTVASGIDEPIDLRVLPDGRLLVLRRGGQLVLANPNAAGGAVTNYLTINNVDAINERGALGLALDPNFAANGYLYVYYANSATNRGRVSRFQHAGSHAHGSSETVVWEDQDSFNAFHARYHMGGGLEFASDGTLFVAIGDKWSNPTDSQDLNKTAGKLLRLDPQGLSSGGPWQLGAANAHLIPSNNPFVDGAGGVPDEIFALGLRNPFRLVADPQSDRIYVSDVGANQDSGSNASWEEIHTVRLSQPARNFGWPQCEGPNCNGGTPSNYSAPSWALQHPATAAILVGDVTRGGGLPSSYSNKLLIFDHERGWLRTLPVSGNGNLATSIGQSAGSFASEGTLGRLTSLRKAPDGTLYYTDWENSILGRISYDGANQPPVITSAWANPTSASQAPATVSFGGGAYDPEGASLDFQWSFGDGQTSGGPGASHTYGGSGSYTAILSVSDGEHTTYSEPIPISIGNGPTPSIDFRPMGTFVAGETLVVVGSGTDPDESLDVNDLYWTMRFLHNDHSHPIYTQSLGSPCGPGGSSSCATFTVPTSGHDYAGMTAYEVTLTAVDSSGLSESTSFVLYPEKVGLTLSTNVPGAPALTLDQIPRITPYSQDTLVGFQHQLTSPATVIANGDAWEFVSWSDGNVARTRTLNVGTSSLTAHAIYTNTGPAERTLDGLVALYRFDEGGGNYVADSSGYGNPLPLVVLDPTSVTWGAGTLTVDSPATLATLGPATKINQAIRDSNAFTIEAWLAPDNLAQSGPARIAGLSFDTAHRNLTLGQGGASGVGNFANLRLRTTQADENGEPSTSGPSGSLSTELVHVAFTRDALGNLRHYVAGQLETSAVSPGTLSNWNLGYPLVVANEATRDRPWLGTLGELAFYDRALTPAEILSNAGATSPSGNQPPVTRLDEFSVLEGAPVLGNVKHDNGHGIDFDPDGDAFGVHQINGSPGTPFTWIQLPSGAEIQYMPSGWFVYRQNGAHEALGAGETFTDGFSYTVFDGPTSHSTGAVTIEVVGENDPPTVTGPSEVTVSTQELLAEVFGIDDVEGDSHSLEFVQGPPFVGLFYFDGTPWLLGYPPAGSAGNYTIHLRGYDSGIPTGTRDFYVTLTVLP